MKQPHPLGRPSPAPHAAQLEDAARECKKALYPATFDVLNKGRFALAQRFGRIGSITIGDISYGRDVRVDCGELGTSYHVNLPIAGHLESWHRGVDVIATRERAAVYQPEGEVVLTRWAADCRQLCVKVDRITVDHALEDLLGRPVSTRIAFAPSMDMTTGRARSWVQLLLTLNHQLRCTDSIVVQPLVARPLAESLVRGFLFTAEHQYSEKLTAPVPPCHPVAVRTAIDIIESSPETPLTSRSLAARCHVSVRTLQEGFQRHIGMSPTAYLRRIRLRRAHDELRATDPFDKTVASIAHHWGFTHLGRFAAAHEAEYGESPVEALRSA